VRIISGIHKGRKIIAPDNLPVRPTTDRGKESLFNILNNYFDFEETDCLDLFAGTGNISYELVSRGCRSLIAVDIDAKCTDFIEKTLDKLEYMQGEVFRWDVFRFIQQTPQRWNLIFADPPYRLENMLAIPELVFENKLLNENGYLVIEHDKHVDFSENPFFKDHRKYGKVNFSFFCHPED